MPVAPAHFLGVAGCCRQGSLLCARVAAVLTLLFAPQTDRALWTVQLQRKVPWQEVCTAVSTEPTALGVDMALRLCGEP